MNRIASALVILSLAQSGAWASSPTPTDVAPGNWAQIAPQLERARYEFQARDGGAVAHNRAQDFRIAAGQTGLDVNGALRLRAVALNGEPLPDAEPVADGQRLEYRRGPVMEWYENRADGLEQGFTVGKPWVQSPRSEVELTVAFETELSVRISEDGQAVLLTDEQGEIRYRYAGLKVTDAAGSLLPASFDCSLNASRGPGTWNLRIRADAREALFPVTIDPVLTGMARELGRFIAGAGDHFASAVAVDGDMALVGSVWMDMVYVFERDPNGSNTWKEVCTLPASGVEHTDEFGCSVAVDGDVAVVGAYMDDNPETDEGSACIFERNAGGTNHWGMVKKFSLGDTGISNHFGYSVAVAGDVVVVGAEGKNSAAGKAYVF